MNGETITLAQYAARLNIQLLKPSDFNSKLREHGVDKKVTVQKICRACTDEEEARRILGAILKTKSVSILTDLIEKNGSIFAFERLLSQEVS